jgi:hypothetical protein
MSANVEASHFSGVRGLLSTLPTLAFQSYLREIHPVSLAGASLKVGIQPGVGLSGFKWLSSLSNIGSEAHTRVSSKNKTPKTVKYVRKIFLIMLLFLCFQSSHTS